MRRFKIESLKNNIGFLRGKEARHAIKVLRLSVGDEVIVFDGNGNEYLAKIEALSTSGLRLKILKKLEIDRESPLDTRLYLALTNKLSSFELALQKATELGVKEIVPVICKRSSFGDKIKNWEGKLNRWKYILTNAAKQCGRNLVPQIYEPIKLKEVVPEKDLNFVMWEVGGRSLKRYMDYSPASVSILIGPEGGLEKEEVDFLVDKGFKVITLGKRILKVETAAIVSLALVQFMWGDIGEDNVAKSLTSEEDC